MTGAPALGTPDIDKTGLTAGIIAMVLWSAGGVLAKGIDLPGLTVISYRMVMYVGLVVLWARWRGTPLTRLGLRTSLVGGMMLGVDLAFFYIAVKETTVANATVIGACQPVIALIIGPMFFKERPRKSDYAWATLAIVGVVIVVLGSSGVPEWSPKGDLAALAALVFFTLYFTASKAAGGKVSSTEYTAGTAVWATIVVVPLTLLVGPDFGPPGRNSWIALVVLALIPGMFGHLLMNFSFTKIPLWLGSTLTLFIPVSATLLAWVFLDEQVVAIQFVGMAVVIASLMAVIVGPAALRLRRPGVIGMSEPR